MNFICPKPRWFTARSSAWEQRSVAVSWLGQYRAPFRRYRGSREMVHSSARVASGTSRGIAGLGTLDGGQRARMKDDGAGQKRAPGSARVAREVQIQGRGIRDDPHGIRRRVLPSSRVGQGRGGIMTKPCACGGGATICAFRWARPMPSWEKRRMPNRNFARYSLLALTMRTR